jgi:hypothetical protein
MKEQLDADMANTLDAAYTVARQARVCLGGGPQDLMILEECAEAIEALSALQVAVAKRLNHRGLRGKVDEELADALLTILGAMPAESEAWVWLRGKTERLGRRISEVSR